MRRATFILTLMAFMVVGMFGVAYATHYFSDVEDTNVHADSVEWAADNGVVDGYGDGTFGPDDYIKRDQAASMFKDYHDAFEPRDGEDGARGATGPQGPAGPEGPQGPAGDDATVGISHWSEGGTVPPMQNGLPGSTEVVAECQQEGHLAIAGGYTAGSYKGGVTTYQNRNTAGAPDTEEYGAGWLVGFTNTTDKEQSVRTWVVCASVVEDEPAS